MTLVTLGTGGVTEGVVEGINPSHTLDTIDPAPAPAPSSRRPLASTPKAWSCGLSPSIARAHGVVG